MFYDDLKTLVHQKPFRPFRLFVTDGSIYDVRFREGFLLTHAYMIVGLPTDPNTTEPDFARATHIDLLSITQVEPLPIPVSPHGNGQTAD
jgi:hypothetical protein